jgi:7-cyano-7-deazaguanine synthase
MNNAIVLLSGGIDSATCCAIAKQEGFALHAMSFSYGQRHSVELEAAARVAAFFTVNEHKIVDIDLRAFGGSSLTAPLSVPKNRNLQTPNSEIPLTYVPARNTIFLSYALAWAEVLGAGDIFIGVNAVDYSGYPDCRPEFIKAFETMANLATRATTEGARTTIHTPIIDLGKSDIVRRGMSLGVDYALTVSCYQTDDDGRACGVCDACRLRRAGFLGAGVADPTRYR